MADRPKHRHVGSGRMDALYRVRSAAEPDLPGILEIERGSFSDPWPRSFFLQLLRDPSWVAEAGGQVVGYLFGRVAADEAEVLNIAVHTGYRRQGVARRLLGVALDAFASAGAKNAYLEVRSANSEALSFYLKSGFREQGRRRRYYDNPPDDAVLMKREIPDPKTPEIKG